MVQTDELEMPEESIVEGHGVLQLEYSVKIINPEKLSDYKSVRLCKWKCCEDLKELRLLLRDKVPPAVSHPINFEKNDLGYIDPGHGLKGRKHWLSSNEDLKEMYQKHVGKRNILLWIYFDTSGKSSSNGKKNSNFEQHKKTCAEVDENYDKLRKKHGATYTPEQFRMWAQLIRLGKHDSLDQPPDLPFWRGRKRKHGEEASDPTKVASGFSPAKKVSVRSELLDQLAKWHRLSEAGVVSGTEYNDLKTKILSDIKEL